MKVLIDMNLSPSWAPFLARHGFDAIHWSAVGDARARDAVILQWARDNQHIIFTHDLDFSALLAATIQNGPSVLQIRSHDIMPAAMELCGPHDNFDRAHASAPKLSPL